MLIYLYINLYYTLHGTFYIDPRDLCDSMGHYSQLYQHHCASEQLAQDLKDRSLQMNTFLCNAASWMPGAAMNVPI